MKIGIGICTYNRLHLLQRCVKSIVDLTPRPYRLVIASDGSTDGTHVWLKKSDHMSVRARRNRGVCANKNRLLAKLDDCDYIFVLEDDIIIRSPRWIEWYIRTSLESGYEHFSYMNKLGRGKKHRKAYKTTHVMKSHGTTGHLAFLTKNVIARCGGYNTKYRGHGFGHLEYSKRINWAFRYGEVFLDSQEGNLCIESPRTKSVSKGNDPENLRMYKHFKKHMKKKFHKLMYCRYKK